MKAAGVLRKGEAADAPSRAGNFVDDALRSTVSRALSGPNACLVVHLRVPAGAGRTTLAMKIAARIGRPMTLLTGEARMTPNHLVGRDSGAASRQVIDRFVHTVAKIQTETSAVWAHDALTRAIVDRHTLIYDEFTRSSAAANNPLLSALEERMLALTGRSHGERILRAHDHFRVLHTSSPTDYRGVVATRARADHATVGRIVDTLLMLRATTHLAQNASVRSSIMVAKVAHMEGVEPEPVELRILQLALDVLESKRSPSARESRSSFREDVVDVIRKQRPGAPAVRSAA